MKALYDFKQEMFNSALIVTSVVVIFDLVEFIAHTNCNLNFKLTKFILVVHKLIFSLFIYKKINSNHEKMDILAQNEVGKIYFTFHTF